MTLPVALSGTDIIGQAKTGTGKTLGFGLPLVERVTVPADVEAGRARPEDLTDAPQALVVVPTRELCQQVTNDLLTAGKVRNVRVTAIYGGRAYEPQVEALKKGVDVVVGTPGRLLDLAGQRKLDLSRVKSLVLDEADEMLDLGFLPDVEKIIAMLPAKRQTMLFSATMPGAVIGLARRYMSQPTHIRATDPGDEGITHANIKQFVYRAHSLDKPEMVARILQAEGRALAMIFCRTKRTAADIAEQLQRRGFASGAVHGDLGQGAREQALRAFRNGKVDVLVCTDVAARGIDVENVTHVINYQSPEDEKTYLHRVGRTGRAGASGTAITFVDWDDIPRWQLINKALELDFNDPVETYSSSPHLFEDLGIPAGTKGVLPRSERTRAGLDAEVLEDLGEPGGRGPRGRGGRGGRDESRSDDRERSARTPRNRRRTRGGARVEGEAAAGTPVAETAESAAEGVTARTPRRRRRTRGGAAAPSVAAAAAAPVEAESAVAAAEGPAVLDAPEAEAGRPRRRRTRRSAEATTVVPEAEAAVATPVVEAPAVATPVEVTEPEAPVTRARRTRRTAAAAPAETAVDTAEATEAKPRVRRTRKAVEPEAPAAGIPAQATQEPDAPAAKPRRTRKTAATAPAETVADTVEAVEAKPRRTRKTAATATDTDAVEAKPKRTRKTAATATEAVDTVEGVEAKPRRTRKTAATKPAADTETAATADAVEAVEAKPRRTRKTAATTAATAAVDTAEAVEAKPRRTRKTAATATDAAIDADTAEAKPKRTRKTAATAAVETAEGTEAKPRVRRTRKAAEPEAPAAGIPAQATQEPDAPAAKPRRTRKTAAAKPAADTETAATETVEAAPRARRTRKAAEPAEG
ncbi:DEAD/DEAH box helicase [Streptomyces sp. NPDC005017]|uniref:DEAD/DEAH box helicase n=1 Tax=Streptomyces sp. NPDC005017 TaxID=3364706 RepID=UPI003680EE04